MDPRMTTIATKLRNVGYHTVAIGKWHAGMSTMAHVPGSRGFDRSLGYLAGSEDHFTHRGSGIRCRLSSGQSDGGQAANITGRNRSTGSGGKNTTLFDMYDTLAPVLDTQERFGQVYNGDIFGRLAVATVNNHSAFYGANSSRRAASPPLQPPPQDRQPLFVYLAFANAHHPMEVPPEWLELYPNTTTTTRQTYQAMVSFVDVAIGNLTAAVKAVEGMWENSIVVVCSDNGGPSLTDLDTSNNYPLRGGKYSLFEGGMRVTSFVSGGVIPAAMRGKVSNVLAHTVDFYATFAHLAGAPIADTAAAVHAGARGVNGGPGGVPPVDSANLWPILSGATDAGPRAELPLSIGPPGKNGCSDGSSDFADNGGALIVGAFKLIVGKSCPAHWTGPDSPNGTASVGLMHDCGSSGCLYNLLDDPTEHFDLALSGAKTNATLAAILAMLQKRMVALNRTVFQTAYDASPITDAECSTPQMQAMLKAGVWSPWQQ